MSDSEKKEPAESSEPKAPSFKDEVLAELKALSRSFFKGLASAPSVIVSATKESIQGLKSEDAVTRRWSRRFIASLIGALLTVGIAGKIYFQHKQAAKQAAAAAEKAEADRQAALEEERLRNRPPVYQSLGPFSLELREKPGVVRPKSSMNTAEMEIVVACQDPLVCEWIKEHIDITRGELSPLFVPTDRDQLLSIPGKKAFREEIRDLLNRMLERQGVEGEIIDILFPRFIMS